MPLASRRTRHTLLAMFPSSLGLLLLAQPAHGGWGPEPVQVHATAARCPLVSASDDAARGAIIVWQEETANGGQLRAQHLLANGEVDPAWSGPVQLSNADVARGALGSVTDGAGGAYVWWMVGAQLYLTRLGPDGAVATGWPNAGRALGMLVDARSRPVVCADGDGGVYAAWPASSGFFPAWMVVSAHHLGPANTAKAGWPSGGRTLGGTVALSEHVNSFGIATASDGGLWLAYASTLVLDDGTLAAGEVRVTRLTGAGVPSPGWTGSGVSLAPFRGDLLANSASWGLTPPMRLAAVTPDAQGGAFVAFGEVEESPFGLGASDRVQRVGAAAAIAPGWPAGGIGTPPLAGFPAVDGSSAATSLALFSDLTGGAFVGRPGTYDHGSDYGFKHVDAGGGSLGEDVRVFADRVESQPRGDGGVVVASFFPTGPYGPYSPAAYLQVGQSDPGGWFSEYHDQPVIEWYGDIGLTTTGDGGSIFAWSQVHERLGIFAIRMNPAGIVTGVPPGGVPRALRIWFTPGDGIRVAGGAGAPISLHLHDVTGREVARGESDGASSAWNVPGTRDLPAGVYFARARDGVRTLGAKVLVLR